MRTFSNIQKGDVIAFLLCILCIYAPSIQVADYTNISFPEAYGFTNNLFPVSEDSDFGKPDYNNSALFKNSYSMGNLQASPIYSQNLYQYMVLNS